MKKKAKSKKEKKALPKWKDFELLVAEIHKNLYPQAEVHHNEFILGGSQQKRQFDVTIRTTLGPHRTLTVIDCKQHKAPVDIGYVEQWKAQADDVLADMKVIVSS